MKIHPDGQIMALGSQDGSIKIWNILDDTLLANLKAHEGSVDKLSFSENGYYFSSASNKDGTVKIWDLRGEVKSINTIQQNNQIGTISFDPSGQYFAVGSQSSIQIYNSKSWEVVKNFEVSKDLITDLKFGIHNKFIACTSLDRHLSILY